MGIIDEEATIEENQVSINEEVYKETARDRAQHRINKMFEHQDSSRDDKSDSSKNSSEE